MMHLERAFLHLSNVLKLNFCKGIKKMRKYFLLAGMALMATTTANATTDYAEVTAKATIQIAGQLSCPSSIDFGTIVVKANNAESFVSFSSGSFTGDILSVSGFTNQGLNPDRFPEGEFNGELTCGVNPDDHGEVAATFSIPPSIKLKNGEKEMTLALGTVQDSSQHILIFPTLTVPQKVTAGDYIGAFTVTATY